MKIKSNADDDLSLKRENLAMILEYVGQAGAL